MDGCVTAVKTETVVIVVLKKVRYDIIIQYRFRHL